MRGSFASLLVFLATSVASFSQTKSVAAPDLPADVPKNADIRIVLSDGSPSGQDAVWKDADGTVHEFFQFNDRGRGPKTYTTFKIDSSGLITDEHTAGVDYMKKPVEETFSLKNGAASWKNQAEDEHALGAGKFYVDMNGGPESGAMLARALLKQQGHGPLIPGGMASIRRIKSIPLQGAGGVKVSATLYEITGLYMTPTYMWLDDNLRLFGVAYGWSAIIRQGFESSAKTLQDAQDEVDRQRWSELARKMIRKPVGDLVIKNVSVFDAASGTVLKNRRITVHGQRIQSVEEDNGQAPPASATVIDGTGKMALPGLWDMHAHLGPDNAFLDIAAGVTSVRDMGNKTEDLDKLDKSIQAGEQVGPRIVRAGFIDGSGPFQGPISNFADTTEQAIAWVNKFADLGYAQIKIYSSIKPELVPVIAAEAHKHGLRVSGHVPSGMIAEQFIAAGADEIQHINFIMLNFMPDVKETRNPDRFIMPGKRGYTIDPDSAEVGRFISFLREHHTVIDPTMAIFEATYTDRPGKIGPLAAPIYYRLPVQTQRGVKTASEALPVDAQTDKTYRQSWATMVRMLKKLHDSGVPIVAGTDMGSGYAIHREFEIYNEAGIPAADILRIATVNAATLMKRDKDLGTIAQGKLADIVLVNGDPTARISDIRRIDTVIKNGDIMKPAELYPAMGIAAK